MKNETLHVEGMSCGHCVKSVEGAVKNIGADAKVNLEKKTVEVVFDESSVTLEAIKNTIEEQGYDVV
ncbi:copper ion binding protein [Paenibacillus typhae]|uniref:copper ion binding protein n=1 Tax=Paenibacillus typhae TaxID=1174501 RepID=UPI001C8DA954|nr:copper ion binding protein [Paenibacillus typhae]MBY0012166.1 heavy-metal-associated domain-containing protein [Paenibacillus typhae]